MKQLRKLTQEKNRKRMKSGLILLCSSNVGIEIKNNFKGRIWVSAIKMYEQGKSYGEIERYLQYEQSIQESLKKVDYYGGQTLKEARQEIEDDELELW